MINLYSKQLRSRTALIAVLILVTSVSSVQAQAIRTKVMTRVFWQDRDTDQLSYADITTADKWSIKRGWVEGFPKLDAEKQDLVQMKECSGVLMVGVRDHDDGKNQSGWVAIDTGVFEEPHGNHTHWKYTGLPAVKQSKLDADQGNPAHLYVYDRQFYLANDTKNGFTKASPLNLKNDVTNAAEFFPGGGNHITMGAVNNSIVYSTWIDGGGDNAGRVDVVSTTKRPAKIEYSFKLPSGVIHGATYNSGKMFFAPNDGVCWVTADTSLSQSADTVKVNHLSLGDRADGEKELRTGSFINDRNWVLFTTGSGEDASLCMINAAFSNPTVRKLQIDVADGLQLTSLKTVLSLGKRYAFVFQDRKDSESDVQEKLTIVELDPNRDRDYSDARVLKSIFVGASKVDGHYGHHAISFDAYGRHAIYTEPADGIINVMSLQNLSVVARFRVGGTPDNIVSVGAPEHFH